MTILCRNCGSRKTGFRQTCKKCGFKPKSNREQAEALLLSDFWLVQNGMNEADAKKQILLLQDQIKSKTYVHSDSEIQKAEKYLSELAKEEWRAVFRVLRFLSPLFLIIVLAGIVFGVRHCS
jgi:hypothetical protein